jgi:ubiquinone/menaquinone biosynthesis C-methylase UbiE
MDLDKLYSARFPEQDLKAKELVWKVLCEKFFQKWVRETDTVLDLGAGHGEFLRHIRCASKIAVELHEDAKRWLPQETRLLKTPAWQLNEIPNGSVNVVFASNFFEHLPDKDKLLQTLAEVNRILVPDGILIILQPNMAFLHGRFFDFFDHYLPLTHKSMAEALILAGLQLKKCIPRFLPYTTRSRFPQSPWLVNLYLRLPLAWRILGKQMFIIAQKQTP